MDINNLKNQILKTQYKTKPTNTMFGVNIGVELNERLTDYAKKNRVSKSVIVKNLLIAYLNEVDNKSEID